MKSKAPSIESLKLFYEMSLDLLAVATMDGFYQYLNPAWERTLGYSLEYILSRPFLEFVHADDIRPTFEVMESLTLGQPVVHFENRYVTAEGKIVWLSWKATPHEDGSIYAIARDVTKQKEAEQNTLELLDQLRRSNEELDQFAFIVSHDLKSPLRGITSLSEWIAEDLGPNLPAEVQGHLNLLNQRVEWMQKLINDLLRYARTGRLADANEWIDLEPLIRTVIQDLQAPIEMQFVVQKKLPRVFGVKIDFYQIFHNLIGNAVKYRSTDKDIIEIGGSEKRDKVEFWVKDQGLGIDKRYHTKIFQVFQRLDGSKAVEGTGIGLAIVKKIVEAQDGQISLQSEAGKGSTFKIQMPKHWRTLPRSSKMME